MPVPTLNNAVKFVFVHHTAVSYKDNPDQWHQTNVYHQQIFNFRSSLGNYAGYTYEIAADGTVRQARKEGEETAAVLSFNRQSISICLDGNFDIEKPTREQCTALRELIVEIQKRWDVPITSVLPHRIECGNPVGSKLSPSNLPYKTCYGKLLADDWAQRLVLDPASIEVSVDPYNPPLGSVEDPDREAA